MEKLPLPSLKFGCGTQTEKQLILVSFKDDKCSIKLTFWYLAGRQTDLLIQHKQQHVIAGEELSESGHLKKHELERTV